MADILTGVRARFSLNGVVVGFATGVTVRQTITYEPVKVLDDIVVKEHVPTDYDVSMTADFIRIVGNTVKSRGEFPSQGVNGAAFLSNLIASGEMEATVEDNQTGSIVAMVEGVKISEHNLNITLDKWK